MRNGWNYQFNTDDLPKQTIGYMEPIGLPLIRLDVIQETFKRTQKTMILLACQISNIILILKNNS